jgi:hypothetical protein
MAQVVFESESVVSPGSVEESSASAMSWGAVIAGGVAAAAATLVLMMVGSGFGLTMVSPFSNEGASLETVSVSTAVWLVVVQWLAAALAGYLAGRLRTKWVNLHTDEVFFRDTAHGFLAWAVGTLLMAAILGSALSSIVSAGASAVTTVAGGAAMGAASAADDTVANQTGYFVDSLLRPSDPASVQTPASPEQASAEISRILLASAAAGEMDPADRTYLEQLVAARAGIPPEEAKARVDQILQRADAAAQTAKEAADNARKTAATVALLGALSLMVGAFIASAAAAFAGRMRDENEGAAMLS